MMKRNIIIGFLALMISQSVMALRFEVVNMTSMGDVYANPSWGGRAQGWGKITKDNYKRLYDTGANRLRVLVWNHNNQCWRANLERDLGGFFDRFRGLQNPVLIKIYNNGRYTIDLKGGFGEGMMKQAELGNC